MMLLELLIALHDVAQVSIAERLHKEKEACGLLWYEKSLLPYQLSSLAVSKHAPSGDHRTPEYTTEGKG